MPIVKSCSCSHEYQDKTYGRGNRVHNECGGKNSKGLRCTVCGTKKEDSRG
jgi:hypothetical protein